MKFVVILKMYEHYDEFEQRAYYVSKVFDEDTSIKTINNWIKKYNDKMDILDAYISRLDEEEIKNTY